MTSAHRKATGKFAACMKNKKHSGRGEAEKADITFRIRVSKTGVYTFAELRKGLGNEACPKWNPQSEFTSDEENSEFQGIYADGTNCLYFCLFVKGLNEMSL